MVKELLNVSEVAKVLGIKPQTVYQYVSRGIIPFVKIGSRVRFDEQAIIEWINSKKAEVIV